MKFGRCTVNAFKLLSAVLFAASFSVSAASAFDPIFDAPGPVPGPVSGFGQPPFPGAPFPLPGVPFPPGLPGVALPGSGIHYGGMLPAVSTSSVDFDITEVDPPQNSITFNAQVDVPGGQVDVSVQFDNNDGM